MVFARWWVVGLLVLSTSGARALEARPAPPVAYALELKGGPATLLLRADLGGIGGEVSEATRAVGNRAAVEVLSRLKIRPIVVEVTGQPSPVLAAWVGEWASGAAAGRMSGAILVLGPQRVVQARLSFFNAIIESVTVSKASRTTAGPASLRVEIWPETTRLELLAGGAPLALPPPAPAWNAASFNLVVNGMTPAPTGVESFGPIKCARAMVEPTQGPSDTFIAVNSGRLTCSSLDVTFGPGEMGPWLALADAALWRRQDVRLPSAALTFLAPDQQPLFSVILSDGFLVDFEPHFPRADGGADPAPFSRAQLKFQRPSFQFGSPGKKGGEPPPPGPLQLLGPGKKG